jgi:hypothetical protein
MADPTLTTTCAKCGRRLSFNVAPGAPDPMPVPFPAYCPKCELVNALLVERYTTHVRTNEDGE